MIDLFNAPRGGSLGSRPAPSSYGLPKGASESRSGSSEGRPTEKPTVVQISQVKKKIVVRDGQLVMVKG